MSNTIIGAVTNPFALCAYAIFVIYWLAKKPATNRVLIGLAAFMAVIAFAVAIFQILGVAPSPPVTNSTQVAAPVPPPAKPLAPDSVSQISGGAQSPNVSGVVGNVDIRYGPRAEGSAESKR